MEENKEKEGSMRGAAGVAMTILGGCLWGFSGACGQYLFNYKDVTAKWLVPVRLMTAGALQRRDGDGDPVHFTGLHSGADLPF